MDLDIDSDNNNGFELPDRSSEEESLEDYQSGEILVSSKPGKVILVGDSDVDKDGIADYADGFDSHDNFSPDDVSMGLRFVPLVLDLPPLDLSTLRIKFKYEASDPRELSESELNPYVLPDFGSLRLWIKDGQERRSKEPVSDGGDFVENDVIYTPQELGIENLGQVTTLFVEAVKVSNEIADQSIQLFLDFGNGQWHDVEKVDLTVTKIEILAKELNDTGFTVREGLVASTVTLNNVDQGIIPEITPGAFALYKIRIYDPRTDGISEVQLGDETLSVSLSGEVYESEEFYYVTDGDGINFPNISARIIPSIKGDIKIEYNPNWWPWSKPKLIPAPDSDKIAAKAIKEVVEEMKGNSWTGGAGNGAFGIEVDNRVGARLAGGSDGWYSNIRVKDATGEIVSVNGNPVLTPTTTPSITGTTEIDLMRTKKVAGGNHVQLTLGSNWNAANVEEIYEIKTSIRGKVNADQLQRLKSLKGGANPKINLVTTEYRWTASAGWHKNRKFTAFVKIISFVTASAVVYNIVRNDQHDAELVNIMETADEIRRLYPPGNDDRMLASNALLWEINAYLSNFMPDGTSLDIATMGVLYTKVLGDPEFAPIE